MLQPYVHIPESTRKILRTRLERNLGNFKSWRSQELAIDFLDSEMLVNEEKNAADSSGMVDYSRDMRG